jgi:hypothetical protein
VVPKVGVITARRGADDVSCAGVMGIIVEAQ